MTVVLRHNDALALNLVEYRGSVTLAELKDLATFQAAHPVSLKSDCLNLVPPGADFRTVDLAALDTLFRHYIDLFAPLDIQIFRRAAWICQSEAAEPHIDHWLVGRDTRKGMSSDVRRCATFSEAGDWLVLSEAEIDAVERGDGFTEIARFGAALGR